MAPETLTGLMRLRVRGRSMTPTLRPGDAVVVAPVLPEALTPGDWVVVRAGFLHRYLGRRGDRVLTKGDSHLGFDPPWEPGMVVGRVVEASREEHCFYRRTASEVTRERLLAAWHWGLANGWEGVRRLKAWWLSLLLAVLVVGGVWAAVTVDEFYAQNAQNKIVLHWHTASETGNAGFFLWRHTQETGNYEKISLLIFSEGDLLGADYQYEDVAVTPGILYYYKLQDAPSNGAEGTFFGPITATLKGAAISTPTGTLTPTPTGTPTPTPTGTLTSTPTGTPTPTPHPNVRFEADKTELTAGECTVVRWMTTNLKSVYLDSRGVVGEGTQTFCPCVTEEHILDVIFQDGTGEQFKLTLNVTGVCQVGTPTPMPSPTLPPSPTEDVTVTEVASPQLTVTDTPMPLRGELPTVTSAPGAPTTTPSPYIAPLPTFTTAPVEIVATPVPVITVTPRATVTRLVVEGRTTPARSPNTMVYIGLLVVGAVLGLSFIGGGAWLWRRRQ